MREASRDEGEDALARQKASPVGGVLGERDRRSAQPRQVTAETATRMWQIGTAADARSGLRERRMGALALARKLWKIHRKVRFLDTHAPVL